MRLLEKYYQSRTGTVPYYAHYSLWKLIWIPIRKTLNVVVIPNIPFNSWRIGLYRMLGYSVGKNVFIGMRCYLDDTQPRSFSVGDGAIISYGCFFALHGKGQDRSSIAIGSGVYIGMRCNIVAGEEGLTIGDNAIVGAGSLVNRSVAASTTVVGNPAKEIDSQ